MIKCDNCGIEVSEKSDKCMTSSHDWVKRYYCDECYEKDPMALFIKKSLQNIVKAKTCDDIVKLPNPPSELIELILWTTYQNIKQLYHTRQIEQSKATVMRLKAYKDYNENIYWWNERKNLYKKFTDDIKKTEILRAELRKDPSFEIAMDLIRLYSGERWE